jgi:hypothetical protein
MLTSLSRQVDPYIVQYRLRDILGCSTENVNARIKEPLWRHYSTAPGGLRGLLNLELTGLCNLIQMRSYFLFICSYGKVHTVKLMPSERRFGSSLALRTCL